MGGLLALVLQPKVFGGLAVALLVAFAGLQTARVGSLKAALVDPATKQQWRSEELRDSTALNVAQRNFATCSANQAALQASLDRQNAAVQALQVASAQSSQRATKAAHEALIATENATKLARQVMQPSGDHSCSAAETLINRSLVQ